MSGYTEVIFQALVLFPLAALLITMPFLIHHYRKFGSITFPRVFLVYSFVPDVRLFSGDPAFAG